MTLKEFLLVCDSECEVITLDKEGEYIDSHTSYQATVESLVEFDADVIYVRPVSDWQLVVGVDFDWKEFCNDHD